MRRIDRAPIARPEGLPRSAVASAASQRLYAEVAVEHAGRGVFTYAIPPNAPFHVGSVTVAPLGRRELPGVVLRVHADAPDFPTRELDGDLIWGPVLSQSQVKLANWIARRYRAGIWEALGVMLPPGLTRRVANPSLRASGRFEAWLQRLLGESSPSPGPDLTRSGVPTESRQLTSHQLRALGPISRALAAREDRVFLLHGVTGSGKTEVYLAAAEQVIAAGRQVLILVSEIALTPGATERFSARFPGRVTVLHSALSPRQRELSWAQVRSGRAALVVGSRSAVFAPAERLGLIVVDEEHEWTYKQEAAPRYHTRDVAIARGRLSRACVVLSSATPDVSTYYAASRGRFHLLSLPERYRTVDAPSSTPAPRGIMPSVEIVDLRRELREGNTSIFSRALSSALREMHAKGEQAILFLNRRGAATCVTCRDCGHTLVCRRCETPLAYHRGPAPPTGDGQEREIAAEFGGEKAPSVLLVCHRCNRRRPLEARCPKCGGSRIRYLGVGSQRVEQEVRTLLPSATVVRWDRDSASARGAHEALWRSFAGGEADVLVGTQMVAKALDIPKVTLVGAVLADSALYLPDFRAAERTFQLLTQVSGRAGRGHLAGRAIIQTYNAEHYAISASAHHDYLAFYGREISFRRQFGYPPFRRLVRLVYAYSNEARCWRESMRVRRRLADVSRARDLVDLEIVGPAPCFQRRLRGRYRWQILLFGPSFDRVLDEVPLGPGWSVDVDPVSML